MPAINKGKLTEWNDDKGFGFITPAGGGRPIFVHIKAFPKGRRRPALNNSVAYTVSRRQNKARAENVSFAGLSRYRLFVPLGLLLALGVCLAFFAGLARLFAEGLIPVAIPAAYGLLSLLALLSYGLDKSAAKNGAQRTPELRLHLLELAGGWPGALLAQQIYRHKTRKRTFQFIFVCAIAANCGALYWLVYADQSATLQAILNIR